MKNSEIDTDVAIIGAGSAGVAAAVGAAVSGVDVTLVEKQCFPGGSATAGMVGTVCGLYLTQKDSEPEWAVGGFVKQFAQDLMSHSQTAPDHFYERLHFLPYRIKSFRILCNRLLVRHSIRCLWHTTVRNVNHQAGKINMLQVFDGEQTIDLKARQFIDCTGDSWVSRLAGDDWTTGGENQAAARVFQLTGIKEMPTDAIHFALSLALRRGVSNQVLPAGLGALSVVPGSYTGNAAYFKLPLPEAVTDDPAQRDEMLRQSERRIEKVIKFLQDHAPAFEHAVLGEMAPEVGFRTGRRPIGRDILTEKMVIQGTKTNDAIANGAWPIEYWRPGAQVEMEFFAEGDYYQIPAGCVESALAENLYFAGRNLSADSRALASARVMGICMQTGYAAGILAAGTVKGISRDEGIARIQKELELIK